MWVLHEMFVLCVHRIGQSISGAFSTEPGTMRTTKQHECDQRKRCVLGTTYHELIEEQFETWRTLLRSRELIGEARAGKGLKWGHLEKVASLR